MPTLNELHVQRGRLLERIALQRAVLADDVYPLAATLDTADRAVAGARAVIAYLKARPVLVGVAVAALVVLRGRRVVKLARRGFFLWKAWRSIRDNLLARFAGLGFPL